MKEIHLFTPLIPVAETISWEALASFLGALATVLSVAAVLVVYWLRQRKDKMDAARILLMEISSAEKTITDLKNSRLIIGTSFVMSTSSWQKFQHFFIADFDNDELVLLNDFYNLTTLAQTEINRIKNFLPISNEEKIRLTQLKLLDLAVLCKGNPNLYLEEKKQILEDGFYKETEWFQPDVSEAKLFHYLPNIRFVSTSSCGQKLKRIAKISQKFR